MHITHSNIWEVALDFSHTLLQVMTDDWKKNLTCKKCTDFDNSSEIIVGISIVDYSTKYVH